MPTTTAIILTAIIVVFTLFGIVLAWGEYRTRHLVRNVAPSSANDAKSTTAPTTSNKVAARRREVA